MGNPSFVFYELSVGVKVERDMYPCLYGIYELLDRDPDMHVSASIAGDKVRLLCFKVLLFRSNRHAFLLGDVCELKLFLS